MKRRTLWLFCSALLLSTMWTVFVFAQEEALTPPAADPVGSKKWWVPILPIITGAVVSFAVRFLKGIKIVGEYPKLTVFVISILTTLVAHFAGVIPEGIAPILTAVLAQLGVAIGTHEVTKEVVPEPAREPATS